MAIILRSFKVSQWHSDVAEQILSLIKLIYDNLPRLDIYEGLSQDGALQAALLNVYCDVLEFSLHILRFVKRHTIGASTNIPLSYMHLKYCSSTLQFNWHFVQERSWRSQTSHPTACERCSRNSGGG